jgi:hypothetical protein
MEIEGILLNFLTKLKILLSETVKFHNGPLIVVDIYLYLRITMVTLRYIYALLKTDINYLSEYWEWEIASGSFWITVIFAIFVILYEDFLLIHNSLSLDTLLDKILFGIAVVVFILLISLEIIRFMDTKEEIDRINLLSKLDRLISFGAILGLIRSVFKFVGKLPISVILIPLQVFRNLLSIKTQLYGIISYFLVELMAFLILLYLQKS